MFKNSYTYSRSQFSFLRLFYHVLCLNLISEKLYCKWFCG